MGRAWVFGDNVSTDYIIPGRFNITTNPQTLRTHVFKYIRPDFAEKVGFGDVIVGGRNFGCGSSREHAAIALKASGVHLVAESYGWIFKRNCLNNGFLPIEAVKTLDIQDGDALELSLENYLLTDVSTGKTYLLKQPTQFALAISNAGGLIEYLNKRKEYHI
jgi:3-isopropylmalate/(R)-2-methylmalate dehydratase small subunit